MTFAAAHPRSADAALRGRLPVAAADRAVTRTVNNNRNNASLPRAGD